MNRSILSAFWDGIKKAPWSSQTVSPIVRIGAGFFVLLGTFVFCIAIVATYNDFVVGDQKAAVLSFDLISTLVTAPYIWAIFLRVAICGQAPRGWLPWK